jgi:hypothetical protein
MNRTIALLALLLASAPVRAAIEPPDDPSRVESAIGVLKSTGASESDKLEALSEFTKTTNLTDDAFWALLAVAGNAAADADAVRVDALSRLTSAIAYILPEDVERAEHTAALLLGDKFQKEFAAMGEDPLAELRAKRLYFFGGVTLNMAPALTGRLGPVFLPQLLSSLAAESDEAAMNEGLWSLERLLEINAVSFAAVAPAIAAIATSDPAPAVRGRAAALMNAYAAPRPH